MAEQEQKSVKAKLLVVLKADDTVVAEVENADLWQRVLVAINSGVTTVDSPRVLYDHTKKARQDAKDPASENHAPGSSDQAIKKFAGQLGLEVDVVVGACDPTTSAPFLTLDIHAWEEMKKVLPERGPTALGPIVSTATLLALWFRAAGLGNPTQEQAQAVLDLLNIRDRNPNRGIQRAFWLQARPGGVIVINPAQMSKAIGVAKAFCSREWTGDEMKK